MKKEVKFAVIGDCHYSAKENYSTRDCLGAKKRLVSIVNTLNECDLDFVFSLGDLGDGHDIGEVPEILDVFAGCKHIVKYAIGNHDLCRRTEVEHAEIVNMPAPMYDFSVNGFRFIVLNAFEISRYSRDEKEREAYWNFRKSNPDTPVQEWPGLFRESSWKLLEDMLDDASSKGEDVVILCHVPVLGLSCLRELGETEPLARLVEHEKMLALLDKYTNVRAYIAGHYHPGGLSVRNGVVHKTVRSICDFKEETYCLVTLDGESLKIRGRGMESNFAYSYQKTDIKNVKTQY